MRRFCAVSSACTAPAGLLREAESPVPVNASVRGSNLMNTANKQTGEDLWVFAYGSLMWRPGFNFVERRIARLVGAHRALCVLSFVHRGTPEKPGLVLGLDRGGNCHGIAYRVSGVSREQTIQYLREREQVTLVYREAYRSVWLDHDPEQRVQALCYVVDRGHQQYAGQLTLAQQLHYVRQGHGRSGACRDYVLSTVSELEAHGYSDPELHRLAQQLKGAHQTTEQK
jgi:cation transport protein ChaC